VPDLRRSDDAGSTTYRRLAFGVAAGVVIADQIAKQLATHLLPQEGSVRLIGGLHLQLYRNFAGPGGHWAGHTVAISIFTVLAAVALAVAVTRVRLDRITAIALGLFLGGALGNGLDRLLRGPGPLRGGVVDWLAPSVHGGSMNLADLALNAAVLLLLAGAVLSTRQQARAKKRRRRVDPDAAA
jgi:signal peptidase II